MPITIAPLNVTLTVKKLLCDEKVKKHLSNLGITINSTLTVIATSDGNVIVNVKDGRLALDRNLASKIFVA